MESAEPDAPVIALMPEVAGLPDEAALGKTHSYRGFYEDLAFMPVPVEKANSVSDTLKQCRDLIGTKMTGYKGGDYLVSHRTNLWIAEPDDASGIAISDVYSRGGRCLILTRPGFGKLQLTNWGRPKANDKSKTT